MQIETNAASSSTVPAQKAGSGSGRARAAGDAGADTAGAVSFLSVLHAMAGPFADPALAMGDGSVPAGLPGQQAGAAEGEAEVVGEATVDGEAVPLLSATPMAAVAVPVDGAAAAALAGARPLPGAPAMPGAPTHGQPIDNTAADATDATATVSDVDDPDVLQAALDGAAARKPGAAMADAGSLARHHAADAAALARDGSARSDTAALNRDVPDTPSLRSSVTPQVGANAVAVVSMFEAGLAGLRAGPGGRHPERGGARVHLPDAASTGFVAWSDAASVGTASQPASSVYAPTAATPAPATALAQKMHYWVAGGVQSAELQLDAFEGGSVDVRIAVKGDEAYVEFRSDQPQARKLLLEAMPQLKELLAGEGLMLSGGFVGDSAQNQAGGGRARPDRPLGARTAQVGLAQAPVHAAAPARAASGKAVDLFV